jgi:tetratricopeptide (TPR) repeat protein
MRTPLAPHPSSLRWPALLAGGIIAVAGLAAYHNSFSGAFVLDDVRSIVENPTLRQLWPLSGPFHPPVGDLTVNGRPLLNLSLAVNYRISGLQVWSYHAGNLAIHLLGGLILLGILRRSVTPVAAFAVALLWTVHPLQTESVTYVVQRAESLMGLCYLLTLYCFIRGVEREQRAGAPTFDAWFAASFLACLAGMATKEDMASAPVIVFLYDRTFLSGSFRGAWQRHRRVFLALGGTWILLAGLLLASGASRGRSVGFGLGISGSDHVLTQIRAIAIYLRLAVWPHPLIFDYGTAVVTRPALIVPAAILVALLIGGTLFALVRRPAWGFLGACFLAILAPSSLLPVTTQPIAEHRMYLPLAVVLAGVIAALGAALGKLTPRPEIRAGILLALVAAAAAALGALTLRRNQVYRSAVSLWSDNLAKRPYSPRAHGNLGTVLLADGHPDRALPEFAAALRADPGDVEALKNEGSALDALGRRPEAITAYGEALRVKPDYAEARSDLGLVLLQEGRIQEAVGQFNAALGIDPRQAVSHFALGNVLARAGRDPEAIAQFQAALASRADNAEAHNNLANALMRTDRAAEALPHYREAVRIRPGYADAHYNLGNALVQTGQLPEAVAEYQRALAAPPRLAEAENNLGNVLLQLGRTAEALPHFEAALRIDPSLAEARATLARLRGAAP